MIKKNSSPKKNSDRFSYIYAIVAILFFSLFLRLGYLQIFQFDKYSALAESQRTRTDDLLPRRGKILFSDKDGNSSVVASTRETESAFLEPRAVKDVDYTADKLSDILWRFKQRETAQREKLLDDTGQYSLDEIETRKNKESTVSPEDLKNKEEQEVNDLKNNLLRKMGDPTDPYEPLISSYEKFDEQAIKELKDANLKGVRFEDYYERYYPEQTLAAQVLGYVRQQDNGIIKGEYGIEAGLDDVLQGRAGFMEAERDVVGRLISVSDVNTRPAEDGADVVLTIDPVVQTFAEDIAKQGRDRFGAEKASIIVMDPYSAEIKAMANYPTYNPNEFSNIRDMAIFRNNTILDLFEPGSIFKPIVMGIAMDLGLVNPNTTMEDNGPLKIGKYIINTFDGKHLGTVTMTRILEQSDNVGMVWVAQKIGAEKLFEGLRHFGIGDKTGLPLDGEASSALPLPDTWSPVRLATMGFGQGVVVTPLQILVSDIATINGGKLLAPHIVKEVRYSDGRIDKTQTNIIRQVISPDTANKLQAMLTSVVENGVAGSAKVKGYYVGGKTGTAQVADPKTGRYSADRKIISFFGFAPADKPQFAVLIILDNPKGLSFASGTAAPMFKELATKLLSYYMIPPSRK